MLEAGVSRNVTPPVAKAVLDIRSTPDWTHDEIGELLQCVARVATWSSRRAASYPARRRPLRGCSRPRHARAARTPKQFGSPTCSDWVFLRPHRCRSSAARATSRRSHTPDEYVDLPEVTAATRFYAELACAPTWRGVADDAPRATTDKLRRRRRPLRVRSRRLPPLFAYTAGDDHEWDARSAALGRPRQPRPRRRPPRRAALLTDASMPGSAASSAPRSARSTTGRSLRRGTKTCTPRSRSGSPRRRAGHRRAAAHRPLRATTRSPATSRLFLKTALLAHARRRARPCRRACSRSPARHRTVLFPGYTHQRRAMPSSIGLWAGAYAEGLLDTDRSRSAPFWAPGRPLAARQRRRVRRAVAAQTRGRRARAGLRRARPQRRHGASAAAGKLEAAVLFLVRATWP